MTKQETKKQPMLFSRVDPEFAKQAQDLADREYDGNVSMLVRIAVKRFIENRIELIDRESQEVRVAA